MDFKEYIDNNNAKEEHLTLLFILTSTIETPIPDFLNNFQKIGKIYRDWFTINLLHPNKPFDN